MFSIYVLSKKSFIPCGDSSFNLVEDPTTPCDDPLINDAIKYAVLNWVMEVERNEKPSRHDAVDEIIKFFKEKSKQDLDFSGLGLSTLPKIFTFYPVKNKLKILKIFNNKLNPSTLPRILPPNVKVLSL